MNLYIYPRVFCLLMCVMNFTYAATCPEDYTCNPRNPTRCYKVYTNSVKHNNAANVCQNEHTNLLMIESLSTNTFVNTLMKESGETAFHLGLDDRETEGTYIWQLTGQPLSWSNWNDGVSHNNNGLDCVEALKDNDWKWTVITCNKKRSFVCDCSDPNQLEVPSPAVTSTILYSSEQSSIIILETSSVLESVQQSSYMSTEIVTMTSYSDILTQTSSVISDSSQQLTSILIQSSTVLQQSSQQTNDIVLEASTVIPNFTQQTTDNLLEDSTMVADSTTDIVLETSTVMTYFTQQTTHILLEDSTMEADSTLQTIDILLDSTMVTDSTQQTTNILLEDSTMVADSTQTTDILLEDSTMVADFTLQTTDIVLEGSTMVVDSTDTTDISLEDSTIIQTSTKLTDLLSLSSNTTPASTHRTDSSLEQISVSVSQSSCDLMESSSVISSTESTVPYTEVVTEDSTTILPKMCSNCMCRSKTYGFFANQSLEEVLVYLQEMMAATAQRKSASRKTSVPDFRPSSNAIGSGAVAILSVILIVVVLVDLPNLLRMVKQMKENFNYNESNP